MQAAVDQRQGALSPETGPATVGFVVIGRNEGDRLEQCLRALDTGRQPVVYADSASTDRSPDRARALGAHVVVLDESEPLTAARGRMAGLAALRTAHPECRYVHFIDGDCLLQPGWLEQAVAFLDEHPKVAAVCGQRFEAHPAASAYNQLIDREWNTPVGQADACGGDALMRIEALEQVGGFRPDLRAGEEPELCARLRAAGWQIWRLDARMTAHDARITSFGQWWKRALRSGFGYAQVWERTRALPQPLYRGELKRALIWGAAIPIFWIVLALLLRSPLLLLGLPLTYALQIVRLALRQGSDPLRWRYAWLTVATKFAELGGAIRYWTRSESRRLTSYR